MEILHKVATTGFTPLIPEPFQRSWPALAQLIQDCFNFDPSSRPSALDFQNRLREVTNNMTGNEDDYLGVKSYPLRKYLLKEAMRLYEYDRRSFDNKSSKMVSLKSPYENTEIWTEFNRKTHRNTIIQTCGLCQMKLENVTAKDRFESAQLRVNPQKQTCWKMIDGWTSMIFTEIDVPWPFSNRVYENCYFLIYFDDSCYLDISMPLDHIPGEYSKYLEIEKAKIETGFDFPSKYVKAETTIAFFLEKSNDSTSVFGHTDNMFGKNFVAELVNNHFHPIVVRNFLLNWKIMDRICKVDFLA